MCARRDRIDAAGAQRGKFRMAADKTRYVWHEVRGSAAGVQIRVALRAADVRGCREARMSAVFCMASRTGRREKLIRMVQRRVVAGIAALIAGLGAERAHLRHVTRTAPRAQHSMRRRHFAAAINSVVASQRVPAHPQQRNQRKRDGQNETQAP